MTPALGEPTFSELNRVALARFRFDHEAVLLLAACPNPKSDRPLTDASTPGLDRFQPSHVRLKDFRDIHPAVCTLIVFENRDQRAAHGEA